MIVLSGDYETSNETFIKLMTNTTVLANLTAARAAVITPPFPLSRLKF